MTLSALADKIEQVSRFPTTELQHFCEAALSAAGADARSSQAATRAMLHGSCLGIDSHGVRLLPHYVNAIKGGRVNGRPQMRIVSQFGATAVLDADDAHGALATFDAMNTAVLLARDHGIGAVAIRRTSHFGAAGAYALAAAEAGSIGIAVCNSDSFVRLHGGAQRFHGTNPIAVGVPSAEGRPWLLDMATSAVPYNRVLLYRSLGLPLPEGIASNGEGMDIRDPFGVEMLAPVGAEFGYKGAGLAGLVEILSAVLTGMRLSFDIAAMGGPDFSTPREMGAFVVAIRPTAFGEQAAFDAAMSRYLAELRASRSAAGETVMAPGDREWREAEARARDGIPIDPTTFAAFEELASRFSLRAPEPLPRTERGV